MSTVTNKLIFKMTLLYLLFICGLLGLGSSGNQTSEENSCYHVKRTCTSNVGLQINLLRDNILLVQQSLEKDIQALRTSLQSCSGGHSLLQCTSNTTDNGKLLLATCIAIYITVQESAEMFMTTLQYIIAA